MNVIDGLFSLADGGYRDFHARLMPTVDKARIIGVRVPDLRKYARDMAMLPEAKEFIATLPHKYYDEDNLHAFLIESIPDFGRCIAEVERFLPYIDNWATCDMMNPRVFARHRDELLPHAISWLDSAHTYTVRYGIVTLMRHYTDDGFRVEYLDAVASVTGDDYYIKMAAAWYFATALTKQYDCAVRVIEEQRLDALTHNKAITKAMESYQISGERKAYLRTLKIKK